MNIEKQELLTEFRPPKVIRQLGFDIEDDSEKADFILVFPHDSGANAAGLDKPQEKADEWWDRIFLFADAGVEDLPKKPTNLDGATRRQFQEEVRKALIEVFTGSHCCFSLSAYKSCDGNDIILRIKLADPRAKVQIASDENLRLRVRPEAYTAYGFELPTDAFFGGSFQKDAKPMPGYMEYSKGKGKLCDMRFTEVACIRMMRRRIAALINVGKLIASGVASQGFYVHTYQQLHALHEKKWNDWSAVLQWPGHQHVDDVRLYFGEEYGFFYHWFNFFNRYLVVAGSVGLVVAIVNYGFFHDEGDDLNEDEFDGLGMLELPSGNFGRQYMRVAFSLFMCLWGSVFTKHYQQRSNFKIMEWGVHNYANVAQVRTVYDPTYRDSWQDYVQRIMHWILVFAFICETLLFVYLMGLFREYCIENPEKEIVFGIKGDSAAKGFVNLLVTANIKIIDQIWKRLSPALSKMENWRTEQELKNAMVLKMFIVKFVVYYYPFLFIAFIQQYWYGLSPGLCIDELRYQIYIHFPIEVCCGILFTILPLLQSWWQVRSKTRAKGGEEQRIPRHTELQAATPEYADEDRYQDTMEFILSFGFLMMFTTVLVVMPLIALIANLIQIRVMAFHISFASQRISPRGQEGFGSWAGIVQMITFIGVLCNLGLAVFVMKPFRNLPLEHRMMWFVLGEHVLLCGKLFITLVVPDIADTQKVIEEHNSITIPSMQWRSVHAEQEWWTQEEMEPLDVTNITKVDLSFDKWR